ncbi:unnamed protein product [Urochloa decumbens]|uniref:DUF7086 domain-containing protein n=1 Tax=Urochloa decumbens TaxID=240449 RepID=A0ABC8WJM1_9POAL
MPWSKHYYTVASPPRRKIVAGGGGEAKCDAAAAAAGAKGDDSLCLSLSLGDIYTNNNAPAAWAKADAAAAAGVGGFRRSSPVVAAMFPPAPVLPAPSAAAAAVHPPPLFDAVVLQASGAFFPAAAATAPTPPHQMASIDDVVPAADVVTPPAAATKQQSPAKRPRSVPRRPSISISPGAAADETVEIEGGLHLHPPYPWSTDRVGVHYSLAELSKRGISTITGELQCKRCDFLKLVSLDARARFEDLCGYVSSNVQGMDDRAPKRWREPVLPDCDKCGQRGSMRPVIPADKHRINWVFLLLMEMLGVCTLEQLKHFCAYTQQHRTGAKDRVLYSTYMELCNQLLPNGIFDMESERRKRTRLNV